MPSGPLGRHSVGGKRPRQRVHERRLVLLDRQHVVAPRRDDLRAHLALGEQGVGGHDPPAQRHLRQQLLRRGEFLPLATGLRLMGVRRHQVHARHGVPLTPGPVEVPAGAPQRLAVQRQRIVGRDPRPCQPATQRRLERGHVQRAVHAVQRRDTGPPPGGKAQRFQQLGRVLLPLGDPLRHRRLPPRAAQHRRHRRLQQRHQGHRFVPWPPPVRPPRISHARQRRRQRTRWGGRPARQRLAPPKHLLLPRPRSASATPSPYSLARLMKRP